MSNFWGAHHDISLGNANHNYRPRKAHLRALRFREVEIYLSFDTHRQMSRLTALARHDRESVAQGAAYASFK